MLSCQIEAGKEQAQKKCGPEPFLSREGAHETFAVFLNQGLLFPNGCKQEELKTNKE